MTHRAHCPKCGSEHQMPDLRVHGGFHARSLKVEIAEDPKAWLDKGLHEATLSATVCGQCGFTELYVDNPAELVKAYRQAKPRT